MAGKMQARARGGCRGSLSVMVGLAAFISKHSMQILHRLKSHASSQHCVREQPKVSIRLCIGGQLAFSLLFFDCLRCTCRTAANGTAFTPKIGVSFPYIKHVMSSTQHSASLCLTRDDRVHFQTTAFIQQRFKFSLCFAE